MMTALTYWLGNILVVAAQVKFSNLLIRGLTGRRRNLQGQLPKIGLAPLRTTMARFWRQVVITEDCMFPIMGVATGKRHNLLERQIKLGAG